MKNSKTQHQSHAQKNKRRAVKTLITTSAIATTSQSPWLKPIVQSTILPSHAQSSTQGNNDTDNNNGNPDCTGPICGPLTTAGLWGNSEQTSVATATPPGFMPIFESDQGDIDLSPFAQANICFDNGVLTMDYLDTSLTINNSTTSMSPVPAHLQGLFGTDNYPISSFTYAPIAELPLTYQTTTSTGIEVNLLFDTATGTPTQITEINTNEIVVLLQLSMTFAMFQGPNGPNPGSGFTLNGQSLGTPFYNMQTYYAGQGLNDSPVSIPVTGSCT